VLVQFKAIKPIVDTLIPPHLLHIFYLVARIKYSIVKKHKGADPIAEPMLGSFRSRYISVLIFSEIGSGRSAPADQTCFSTLKSVLFR